LTVFGSTDERLPAQAGESARCLSLLHSFDELKRFSIEAADGKVGRLHDLYFDDHDWVVRYLVVDTKDWLNSRQVLISPYSVGCTDLKHRVLPVSASRQTIKQSPDIDTHKTVSRQHERRYLAYYGHPQYWGGSGIWGGARVPNGELPDFTYREVKTVCTAHADPQLRSCRVVKGYHVHATDGDLGHLSGFIIDDVCWSIRYLVVTTSNWWFGQHVLIAPDWVAAVSWFHAKLMVSVDRDAIRRAPSFDPEALLDRAAEAALYGHHRRAPYWEDPQQARDFVCDQPTAVPPLQ
jgi:hypothetical protein